MFGCAGIFGCSMRTQLWHVGSRSLTTDRTWFPSLEAQCLSHWTTREVPQTSDGNCLLIRWPSHIWIIQKPASSNTTYPSFSNFSSISLLIELLLRRGRKKAAAAVPCSWVSGAELVSCRERLLTPVLCYCSATSYQDLSQRETYNWPQVTLAAVSSRVGLLSVSQLGWKISPGELWAPRQSERYLPVDSQEDTTCLSKEMVEREAELRAKMGRRMDNILKWLTVGIYFFKLLIKYIALSKN